MQIKKVFNENTKIKSMTRMFSYQISIRRKMILRKLEVLLGFIIGGQNHNMRYADDSINDRLGKKFERAMRQGSQGKKEERINS